MAHPPSVCIVSYRGGVCQAEKRAKQDPDKARRDFSLYVERRAHSRTVRCRQRLKTDRHSGKAYRKRGKRKSGKRGIESRGARRAGPDFENA